MSMEDTFECKDKKLIPFFLTQDSVKFLGTFAVGGIVYFKFTPKEECEKLANAFVSKRSPLVQPKDLLDAVETFKQLLFEAKAKHD